jgi:hypothetical protein
VRGGYKDMEDVVDVTPELLPKQTGGGTAQNQSTPQRPPPPQPAAATATQMRTPVSDASRALLAALFLVWCMCSCAIGTQPGRAPVASGYYVLDLAGAVHALTAATAGAGAGVRTVGDARRAMATATGVPQEAVLLWHRGSLLSSDAAELAVRSEGGWFMTMRLRLLPLASLLQSLPFTPAASPSGGGAAAAAGGGGPLMHLTLAGAPPLDSRYGVDAGGCLRAHCPACGVAGAHLEPRALCPACSSHSAAGGGGGEAVVIVSGSLPPRGTPCARMAPPAPAALASASAASGGTRDYTWRDLASIQVKCLRCHRTGPVRAVLTHATCYARTRSHLRACLCRRALLSCATLSGLTTAAGYPLTRYQRLRRPKAKAWEAHRREPPQSHPP